MSINVGAPPRTAPVPPPGVDGGPDLAHLERLLGDLVIEGEIARTSRAVIHRIHLGSIGGGGGGGGGGRPSALKVALQPSNPEDLARFRHEARLLSEVRHPNVVEVHEVGVLPGDFPFLVMELVEPLRPETVRERVEDEGWDTFYDLAIQAAAGLAHIHRHGVVHLDLKPDNLGVDAQGRLKILDFGLAQSLRDPLDRRIRGTLAYVAPEILLQDSYDHRADLYSLGLTLWELATGVLPSAPAGRARADDDRRAIQFHLTGATPDPWEHAAHLKEPLPEPLGEILVRLLDRDPRGRYPSAAGLLEALGEAAGRPIDLGGLTVGSGQVLTSRLVGRDEALGALAVELDAARRGEGRTMLVEGPDGVGKSRLLREFRLLAAVEGAVTGSGTASPERSEPLEPVVRALAGLGVQIEPGAGHGQSGRSASSGPSGPSAPSGRDPSRERERFSLYRQISQALAARATTPLVMILEDLHHASRETAELLAFLASDLGSAPVLVVATRRASRDAEQDGAPQTPLDEAPLRSLRLDPLDRGATVHLIEASLGLGIADSDAPQLSDGFYDQVFEASGGFPGRVQQILRHLIDEDGLRYQDGSWEVRPSVLGSLGGVGGVEALDWHRMASLAPELRRILEAAAVIGEPFRLATLAALLDNEPSVVYESLARVVRAGFLDRLLDPQGAVYTFSQRRLAETLYATLQGGERSDLHLGLARLLERRVEAGRRSLAARVADHFWRAGQRARSLPYLLEAAERAASVYGHAEAASLYGRAAEAALEAGDRETAVDSRAAQARALASAGLPGRALRVYQELLASGGGNGGNTRGAMRSARWLLDKGRIHGRLGEHEAALASFEQALASFEIRADQQNADVTDLELEIELLHGKAVALRDLGQADAAFEAARGALRRASDAGLDSQRAFLLNQLAMAFYARGGQERARRLARRSLGAASKASEPRLEVLARNTLAMVAWKTGDTAGALDLFTENLAACERMNDPWGQLPALNNLGILHCSLGDWRSARDLLVRSLEMKRRLGAREGEALTRINLAEVEEVLGDWRRAQRHVERALALLADQPDHPERIAATTQLASLARKRGDLDRADELLAEAQQQAEGTGDRDLVLRALLERGLLELDREAHGPAGEALERGLELARESGSRELEVRHLTALAQLGLEVGDRAAAARRVTAARQATEGSEDDLAEGRLAALEGQLAALADDGAGAETAFERSARLLSHVGARYDQARTLHRWGLATWNGELAVERLDKALELFQQLGAVADAHEVRSALARIGSGEAASPSAVDGTLYEVVKVINSSLDFQEVLDRTMDLVLERLGAERGMIVLVDPLTREMDVAVARNLSGGAEEGKELSESVVRRVVDTHEPVLAVDAVSDSRFVGAESIVARHILSILCVPLVIRDRLAGAIYIDHRQSKHLFTDADRDFLVAFADGAAVAIENARLYGQLEEARKRLESENASLKREIFTSHHLGTLIGKSRAISALKGTLELVAQGASTVLIRGESGTGKGLVARIIHNISPRRKAPFVHFNCAALPETLVESELFGHEKGSFTGATGRKPGRFELADGGTIFLDEIGKISRSVQAKLLRVVEDKEFERVGGTKTLSSDVRIIAATNLNLEQAIARDEFREDLYYRLNIIPIILPPLRERREDVPYLVQHFLERISRDLGLAPKDVDPAVLDLFAHHDWPGNVRELEAAIHRALVLTPGDTLTPDSFAWIQVATGQASAAVVDAATLARSDSDLSSLELAEGGYQALLDELDGQLVRAALVQSDGKIREAARLLGIARNTLKSKMKKFEIEA